MTTRAMLGALFQNSFGCRRRKLWLAYGGRCIRRGNGGRNLAAGSRQKVFDLLPSSFQSRRDPSSAYLPTGAHKGPVVSRAAAGIVSLCLSSCGWIGQDSCIDDGGVWDAKERRCYCAREKQGLYTNESSNKQLAWREWCADKFDLDSIRNAEIPAPAQ